MTACGDLAGSALNVNGCLTYAGYHSGGEVSVERLCELIQVHGSCLLQFPGYRTVSVSRHVFDLMYYTVIQQGNVCESIILCSSFPQEHLLIKNFQVFIRFDDADFTPTPVWMRWIIHISGLKSYLQLLEPRFHWSCHLFCCWRRHLKEELGPSST